jgi:RNA ligase (TIGR02306 family)
MSCKVCVEQVKVYPHPDPETTSLELVAIGDNQYVVQKGLYVTGDLAVAIPKNFVVSHPVFIREWGSYLQGPDKNRVGFKLMRGQESQGIVVREDLVKEITGKDIKDFEVGVDISNELSVKQYVAPIPEELKDTVEAYTSKPFTRDIKHDCKYAAVNLSKFVEGEPIAITSKLHGSQFNILWNHEPDTKVADRVLRYSTKGLWEKSLVFKQGVTNNYLEAWYNFTSTIQSIAFWNKLSEVINADVFQQQVHLVGEVVPMFKGFDYGNEKPTLYLFAIYVNGVSIDLINFRSIPNINIVPELYRGPFDPITTLEIANNFAQQAVCPIDGKMLNEGVVVSNGRHYIKVKNDKFMKKFGTIEGN